MTATQLELMIRDIMERYNMTREEVLAMKLVDVVKLSRKGK